MQYPPESTISTINKLANTTFSLLAILPPFIYPNLGQNFDYSMQEMYSIACTQLFSIFGVF